MRAKKTIVSPYDPNWKADFEAARDAFRHLDKPHLRTHHLYVCPQDSREPLHHLAFRNYLRQHPEAARKYSLVKETAARLSPMTSTNIWPARPPASKNRMPSAA